MAKNSNEKRSCQMIVVVCGQEECSELKLSRTLLKAAHVTPTCTIRINMGHFVSDHREGQQVIRQPSRGFLHLECSIIEFVHVPFFAGGPVIDLQIESKEIRKPRQIRKCLANYFSILFDPEQWVWSHH